MHPNEKYFKVVESLSRPAPGRDPILVESRVHRTIAVAKTTVIENYDGMLDF